MKQGGKRSALRSSFEVKLCASAQVRGNPMDCLSSFDDIDDNSHQLQLRIIVSVAPGDTYDDNVVLNL